MEFIIILVGLYVITFLFALLRETTFSMVFSLILVFLIACILVFNFNFYFLGFMILIIYVGAIAVLFLFMVMLFDRSEYKIVSVEKIFYQKYRILCIGIFGSLVLSFSIYYCLNYNNFYYDGVIYTCEDLNALKKALYFFDKENLSSYNNIALFIGNSMSYEIFNIYSVYSDAELIGIDLYLKYFFLLIMAGLGLLIAMIGCILITKSSVLIKFERRNQRIERQLSRFKI